MLLFYFSSLCHFKPCDFPSKEESDVSEADEITLFIFYVYILILGATLHCSIER